MAQPVYPINTVHVLPPIQMSLRSRREASTRDTVNARHYELWQTDGKYGIQNRADVNAQPVFQDFQPINSRFSDRNYKTQPRFDETASQGGMNSYFNKYDSASDSRNTVRELQSVVYEDKDEGAPGFYTRDCCKAIVTSDDEKHYRTLACCGCCDAPV